jgi:hypothetical protein
MDEGPDPASGDLQGEGEHAQPGGTPPSRGADPRLVAALVAGVILVFGLIGWLLLHPRNEAGPATSGRPEASGPPPTSTSTVPTEIGVAVTPRLQAIAAGSCRDGTRVFDARLTFTISPAVVIPAFAGQTASVVISGGTPWDGPHRMPVRKDGTMTLVLRGSCASPTFGGTTGSPTIGGAPIAGTHPVG